MLNSFNNNNNKISYNFNNKFNKIKIKISFKSIISLRIRFQSLITKLIVEIIINQKIIIIIIKKKLNYNNKLNNLLNFLIKMAIC